MIRDRRRQIIDCSIIAVVLVVLAVLFWPSFGNGEELDPAPDGVAEEVMTPTADVEPDETVTPEATLSPTPDPDEDYPALCVPGDATQILANFIQRFNDGDFDALAEMLPPDGSESPTSSVYPGMNQHILHSFATHESGAMSSRDAVLDYLAMRHDAGEFWRLKEYRLSRMYRNPDFGNPELDEAYAVIQRSSEEFHTHEMQGRAVINCVDGLIILWEFSTDDPELALPIMIDDFLGAVGPYGLAEMRNLRMIVSTDLRPDGGTLKEWDIRRDEANSVAGLYVERITVNDLSGGPVVLFVYDGQRWYLDQRGWEATGNVTGPTVLPPEIMMTRREPSTTSELIRAHLDQIPEEGTYVIQDRFEIGPEMLAAYSRVDSSGAVEGLIEVEIQDGALVRTRYRLIGESSLHFTAPEIRWIDIVRADRYEATLFYLPQSYRNIEPQYEIPDELAGRMTLVGEIDHFEGIGELYELRWDDLLIYVTVMPSRGGVEQDARGDDWDLVWRPSRTVFDDLHVTVAEAGDRFYPSHALWDSGDYRFELSLDPDVTAAPDRWDMDELRAVVEALTRAIQGPED
jgi:hypothetical protein